MKKLLVLLLVLGMLFSMLPTISAAKNTSSEDIWKTINEIENEKIRPKRGKTVTAEDYAAIVDEVIAAVEDSDSYKEGTIERHGSFFFWETLDGEPNGYSPKLRARMRNGAIADADPEACSGIETTSYATRNSPNAVNIAVFQPYYGLDDSFTTQYKTEGESIAKAIGGTCTTYKTTNATIDAIADAMESCAVVFFDSHGDTDYASGEDYTSRANTSYILLQTNTGWTTADTAKATGAYGTYYHAYNAGSNGKMRMYCVDGTAIANHMEKSAPNNMLWMAICLGMATDGLNAPLRNKGVGVVYGYSQSVTFEGDYFWEETFWNGMKNGKTVSSAISTMKSTGGAWDYSKELYNHNGWKTDSDMCSTITKAQQNRAAFPIVVSAEDAYPGHGKVDNLQTVKSTWTLKETVTPTYSFTAQSNNTAYGTVSVSDNVITPTPKLGCEVVDCTVSPSGAATVTQNGANFVVSNLTANCTITVNFRQKTSYTVTYSVPAGVNCQSASCYAGESVTLTAPSGSPNEMPTAVFCGWAVSAVAKTTAAQEALLASGSKYTPQSNVTLYAVYQYTENGNTYYASDPAECDHTRTYPEHKDATCTEDGYDRLVCDDCGEIVSETIIKALGHHFVDGICTRCGAEDPDYKPDPTPCDGGKDCPSYRFTDVNAGDWYHEAVDFAVSENLFNGMTETTFEPNTAMTRAMLVTVLYRAEGSPDVSGERNPFADVSENQWYHDAVIWAAKEGIVNGTSKTTFTPNASITREQIAAILYRYAGSPEVSGNLDQFPDAPSVSTYAVDAMTWAVGEGIIGGIDGKLCPKENATRAQIAMILFRYLNQ